MKFSATYLQGKWKTMASIAAAVMLSLVFEQTMIAQEKSTEKSEADTFKVGQVVLANWTGDRYWYPATISSMDGDRVHVHYFDGAKEVVKTDRLKSDELKVGDQVYANWQEKGRYYRGKIKSRDGENLHIDYDDGDKEVTTLAMIRVKHSFDPFMDRRATPSRSNWFSQQGGSSTSNLSNQLRHYQLQYQAQLQANAYRRQAQQYRAQAIQNAEYEAARAMRNLRSQHSPYSYNPYRY